MTVGLKEHLATIKFTDVSLAEDAYIDVLWRGMNLPHVIRLTLGTFFLHLSLTFTLTNSHSQTLSLSL
jgi:hypothetical protein